MNQQMVFAMDKAPQRFCFSQGVKCIYSLGVF